MFEMLGGRKMVASTLTLVVGLVIVLTKGDIPPNFLNLLVVTLGTFVGGNVASSAVGALYTRAAVKVADPASEQDGAPAPEAPPVPAQTEGITNEVLYQGLQYVSSQLVTIDGKVGALQTDSAKQAESIVVIQRTANALLEATINGRNN